MKSKSVIENPKSKIQIDPRVIDPRVDQLGYANALYAQFTAPLKQALEKDMAAAKERRREGVEFDAVYLGAPILREVSPAKLLAMYESGKLKRKVFLRCVGVIMAELEKAIGEDATDKLSITHRGTRPFKVFRKRELKPVVLADAMKGLGDAIAGSASLASGGKFSEKSAA